MTYSSQASRSKAGHDLFKGMVPKKKEAAKQKPVQEIQIGEHGRYLVKSGRLAGEFVARAFPKPPTKVRGLIAEATGATEEAAIAALHDVMDARENRRTSERRLDDGSGVTVPSKEEYVEAIGQVQLSGPQMAMLTALALAGTDGLPEVKMASLAGYKSRASARRSFAGAGLLIADYLSMDTASTDPSEELEGTRLLGYRRDPAEAGGSGNWVLHGELRDALRAIM